MDAALREQLQAGDEAYRRLAEQHAHYSQLLDALLAKPYPSDDDKIEETRLKKLKLRLKDEMEALRARHPQQVA